MEWEVVARGDSGYVLAQFRLQTSAQDYCQYRNAHAGRRAWRYRPIDKTNIVVNRTPDCGAVGASAGLT